MAEPGPFDKYQSPWFSMRERKDIEDRRDDPWPWHRLSQPFQITPTLGTSAQWSADYLNRDNIPPITSRLQQEAGAGDVSPITDSELMKFMLDIEAMNPYNPKTEESPIGVPLDPDTMRPYPLPRPDPRKVK